MLEFFRQSCAHPLATSRFAAMRSGFSYPCDGETFCFACKTAPEINLAEYRALQAYEQLLKWGRDGEQWIVKNHDIYYDRTAASCAFCEITYNNSYTSWDKGPAHTPTNVTNRLSQLIATLKVPDLSAIDFSTMKMMDDHWVVIAVDNSVNAETKRSSYYVLVICRENAVGNPSPQLSFVDRKVDELRGEIL